MKADGAQIAEWIDLLHSHSTGLINVCQTGDWSGVSRTDVNDAAHAALAMDATNPEGIYLRITTLASTKPGQERRRGKDIESLACPGFAGDMDLASPARGDFNERSGLAYPPDRATAMSIVEASGLPTPTLWVDSGWGLYPWWLLTEPLMVNDEAGRAKFKTISDHIQKTLNYTAHDMGWDYGLGIGDLSRVLRLPGTVNRKVKNDPRMCHILSQDGIPFDIDELADAVAIAYENSPKPVVEVPRPPMPAYDTTLGLRPGDDFNLRGSWLDILPQHGWKVHRYLGNGHIQWTRPGKEFGISASTGRDPRADRLYVFSTGTEFEARTPINKHYALSLLEFNGNTSACASYLRSQGFGGELPARDRPVDVASLVKPAATPVPVTNQAVDHQQPEQAAVLVQANKALPVLDHDGLPSFTTEVYTSRHWDEIGLVGMYSDTFCRGLRYVNSMDEWRVWDGQRWVRDDLQLHRLGSRKLIGGLVDYARAQEAAGSEHGKDMVKAALKLGTLNKIVQVPNIAKTDRCMSSRPSDYDRHKHLVTVENGILNLRTRELTDFDPDLMLTKKIKAVFDPDAKGPRTEAFLNSIQPDPEVLAYMKRLIGCTILGSADERVLPIVHGASGSGKSAFLEMIYHVLADFAAVADPSTLMPLPDNYQGPSEKLHSLMSTRFVKMSELPENASLNQALVKSITGSDTQKTRPLYGPLVEWQVEYVVWMATNNLPRITSTDGAIWKRVKPIHFPNVFVNEDGSVKNAGDRDLGRQLAREEGSFILNWILEGIQEYLEHGLAEPAQIGAWLTGYRDEMDTTRQFITEAQENGQIKVEEKQTIPARDLYKIYLAWAADAQVRFPLSQQTFKQRMQVNGYEQVRVSAGMVWKGIGVAGFIGQAQTPSTQGNQWMGRMRN